MKKAFIASALLIGMSSIAYSQTSETLASAVLVDEKTGKVDKPAGGTKDCIDAVVSLVALIKSLPDYMHDLQYWQQPTPPEIKYLPDGSFEFVGDVPEPFTSRVTVIKSAG